MLYNYISLVGIFYNLRSYFMIGKFKCEKEYRQREILDISTISTDELNSLLDEGFKSVEDGRYKNVDETFSEIYQDIRD